MGVHGAPRTIAAAAAALASTVTTAAHAFEWEGDLRLGMNDGGDKIGSVRYSNGVISDLKAGTYFTIAGGFAVVPLRMGDHALEVGTLFGYASWSTGPEPTGDRLKLARFPWQLLAHYRFDWPDSLLSLRAGGGMVYHFVPGLSGSGSLSSVDIDVDNGLGWTVEVRAVYQVVALGVGFTNILYDVPGQGGRLNASSFGGSVAVVFPPVGAGGATSRTSGEGPALTSVARR